MCSLHPNLPCFHHRASKLHFNLDRPRLLVWAQAIKSGSATYEKAPILSPMFKASLALKHSSKTAADVAPATQPASSTLNPNTAYTHMPTMPYFPQYPPFPHPYSQMLPFMGYGAPSIPLLPGNPFVPTGTSMVSMPTMPTMDPPSSPPTADCTIAQFCLTYDLGEHTEATLEKLGFRFGDDLMTVSAAEYTEAGFKPLEWRRLLKAYKKLKQDSRSHY
jgi:hypothetical protein